MVAAYLIINTDGSPYKYLFKLDEKVIPASSVTITYKADDTHGLVEVRNKEAFMTFKFYKVERKDANTTVFHIREE